MITYKLLESEEYRKHENEYDAGRFGHRVSD